jgi:hypothetical protein
MEDEARLLRGGFLVGAVPFAPSRPNTRFTVRAKRMPTDFMPRPSASLPVASTSKCTWSRWIESWHTRNSPQPARRLELADEAAAAQ